MHIVFCLPVSGHQPIGGLKVVYEYANGLVRRGHRVTLVHPAVARRDCALVERLARYAVNGKRRLIRAHLPRKWFALAAQVDYRLVLDLSHQYIPDADVVVATAWQTAEWVADYPASKGRKFYFIQSLETWNGPEARVLATWDLPLTKIVIAKWLQRFAEGRQQPCHYLPNALNFDAFSMDCRPEERDPARVLMLYHSGPWKGSADGIQALTLLQTEFPHLDVHLFGVGHRAPEIPASMHYHQCPSQAELRQLYNASAIFLAPSWTEGWGLTAAEAMQCGVAVVATNIGGHQEFMQPEVSALLAPPKHPQALASQVRRLLLDGRLRVELAQRGHADVQRFRWSSAIERLESILTDDLRRFGPQAQGLTLVATPMESDGLQQKVKPSRYADHQYSDHP